MAKNTLHAGDFGYGLLYGGIGTGLVLGSWWSSHIVERIGTTRAYAGALFVMAIGFGAGAAAPNVWVAAACCLVGGVGDGVAIVCNALLVQRGAADRVRGRALTLVMSVTYALNGVGTVIARRAGARHRLALDLGGRRRLVRAGRGRRVRACARGTHRRDVNHLDGWCHGGVRLGMAQAKPCGRAGRRAGWLPGQGRPGRTAPCMSHHPGVPCHGISHLHRT